MTRYALVAALLIAASGCIAPAAEPGPIGPSEAPNEARPERQTREMEFVFTSVASQAPPLRDFGDPTQTPAFEDAIRDAGGYSMLMLTTKPLDGPHYEDVGIRLAAAHGRDMDVDENSPVLPGNEAMMSGPEHWDLTVEEPMKHLRLWLHDAVELGRNANEPHCKSPHPEVWQFNFYLGDTLVDQTQLSPAADEATQLRWTSNLSWDRVAIREGGWTAHSTDSRDCGNDFLGPLLVANDEPDSSLVAAFDTIENLTQLVARPLTHTDEDVKRQAKQLQELLGKPGGKLAVYPQTIYSALEPYEESGISISSMAEGTYKHAIGDWTPLIPGNEVALSGPENFRVRFDEPIAYTAFWFQDGYAIGRGVDAGPCKKHDSQFDATLLRDGTPIAVQRIDPPRDKPVMISFSHPSGFNEMTLREVGSPLYEDGPTCSNDWLGSILAIAQQADLEWEMVEDVQTIYEDLDAFIAVLQLETDLRV